MAPALVRNPCRIGDPIEFSDPSHSADFKLTVFDVTGPVVFEAHKARSGTIAWTGITSGGRGGAPGMYFYLLTPSAKAGKITLVK